MYLCVCLFVCMSNITIFTQEQALAQAELKRLEEHRLLKYNSEEALKRVLPGLGSLVLVVALAVVDHSVEVEVGVDGNVPHWLAIFTHGVE